MNCMHVIEENARCNGAVLKKCSVCNRRQLYAKKVYRCKVCSGYVHKRCLMGRDDVSSSAIAANQVEEIAPVVPVAADLHDTDEMLSSVSAVEIPGTRNETPHVSVAPVAAEITDAAGKTVESSPAIVAKTAAVVTGEVIGNVPSAKPSASSRRNARKRLVAKARKNMPIDQSVDSAAPTTAGVSSSAQDVGSGHFVEVESPSPTTETIGEPDAITKVPSAASRKNAKRWAKKKAAKARIDQDSVPAAIPLESAAPTTDEIPATDVPPSSSPSVASRTNAKTTPTTVRGWVSLFCDGDAPVRPATDGDHSGNLPATTDRAPSSSPSAASRKNAKRRAKKKAVKARIDQDSVPAALESAAPTTDEISAADDDRSGHLSASTDVPSPSVAKTAPTTVRGCVSLFGDGDAPVRPAVVDVESSAPARPAIGTLSAGDVAADVPSSFPSAAAKNQTPPPASTDRVEPSIAAVRVADEIVPAPVAVPVLVAVPAPVAVQAPAVLRFDTSDGLEDDIFSRLKKSKNSWKSDLRNSKTFKASQTSFVDFVGRVQTEEGLTMYYDNVSSGLGDKVTVDLVVGTGVDYSYKGSGDTFKAAQEMAAFFFVVSLHGMSKRKN